MQSRRKDWRPLEFLTEVTTEAFYGALTVAEWQSRQRWRGLDLISRTLSDLLKGWLTLLPNSAFAFLNYINQDLANHTLAYHFLCLPHHNTNFLNE